jgi:hypothetical protein
MEYSLQDVEKRLPDLIQIAQGEVRSVQLPRIELALDRVADYPIDLLG